MQLLYVLERTTQWPYRCTDIKTLNQLFAEFSGALPTRAINNTNVLVDYLFTHPLQAHKPAELRRLLNLNVKQYNATIKPLKPYLLKPLLPKGSVIPLVKTDSNNLDFALLTQLQTLPNISFYCLSRLKTKPLVAYINQYNETYCVLINTSDGPYYHNPTVKTIAQAAARLQPYYKLIIPTQTIQSNKTLAEQSIQYIPAAVLAWQLGGHQLIAN